MALACIHLLTYRPGVAVTMRTWPGAVRTRVVLIAKMSCMVDRVSLMCYLPEYLSRPKYELQLYTSRVSTASMHSHDDACASQRDGLEKVGDLDGTTWPRSTWQENNVDTTRHAIS